MDAFMYGNDLCLIKCLDIDALEVHQQATIKGET